jgi:hypothetical protein
MRLRSGLCLHRDTDRTAFGGVRRSAGKQALQQAQRELGENIREGSRRWNIREGARQENIRECSRTEHRDRSRCKINNEGVQRETAPRPELHTRCAQKLFKEALQRSSSEKPFKEALQRSSSPRNKRRAPSLLCMAVRLRGGVVIPTRLSMHVAIVGWHGKRAGSRPKARSRPFFGFAGRR